MRAQLGVWRKGSDFPASQGRTPRGYFIFKKEGNSRLFSHLPKGRPCVLLFAQ